MSPEQWPRSVPSSPFSGGSINNGEWSGEGERPNHTRESGKRDILLMKGNGNPRERDKEKEDDVSARTPATTPKQVSSIVFSPCLVEGKVGIWLL